MMRSPIYRLIQVITLMIAAVFAVSGFFGLRELAWRHDAAVNTQLLSGLVLSAVAIGVPGLLYILFGSTILRVFRIDWMSLQFGALVGMILYGVYNVITPLTAESNRFDPARRLLTGGIDGLLIGAMIGGVVMFISGRALAFNRTDLLRYLTLYVVVIGLAWFVVVFSTTTNMADVLALAVTVLIVGLIKVIVLQLDRRSASDAE
ncbi:MAG: hypothetical protein IAE80_13110 [Anaerolinea sp.]|nr:hypothetical protein [Anaerolinea sp.]